MLKKSTNEILRSYINMGSHFDQHENSKIKIPRNTNFDQQYESYQQTLAKLSGRPVENEAKAEQQLITATGKIDSKATKRQSDVF